MPVILKVTETRFDKPYLTEECEGSTTYAAIEGVIRQGLDWRFTSDAIRDLLMIHDDVRISTPTWDVHFEMTLAP
jgi:hypothetical protein